jgi:hypothetical protein
MPTPPLTVDFFPGEFRLRDIKSLSRLPFGRAGSLKVEASEPEGVVIRSGSALTNAVLPITLTATDTKGATDPICLRVKSQLHGTTRILTAGSSSALKSLSDTQAIHTSAPEYAQVVQSTTRWVKDGNVWKQNLSLSIPLFADQTPVPTFETSFLTRRYSISLKIDVCGKRDATLELKVPVQLLYQPVAEDGPPSYAAHLEPATLHEGRQATRSPDQLPLYVR